MRSLVMVAMVDQLLFGFMSDCSVFCTHDRWMR
jgi:hypothetical protein